MNIDCIKNWLQENIEYEEGQIARSQKNRNDLNFCWGTANLEMYQDLMTIVDLHSNGEALQVNRKKCPACGEMFTPKNQQQEVCSGKCRTRMHRERNKLNDFNTKVAEILKAKDTEAKFTVEQVLTEGSKCPFIVNYQGEQYKSDSTRNLLNQLKNIH
jgi:predicted nucleic acid-binding Zn ribbon protein